MIKYSFNFMSLISPSSVKNIRLIFQSSTSTKQKKLLVKQSYMLLTWMFYLSNTSLKSSIGGQQTTKIKAPSFFIQPVRKSIFTLLKTPMAHKTFSQEQYLIKFYKLTVSFSSSFNEFLVVNSINQSLLLSLFLRNSIPFFETNLLFLKRIRFSIKSSDTQFLRL